ncbi:hypothetical protein GGI01_000100 [Coemansia sp. RSA 376]|nr:hypothetical protein LPJ71_004758 [Coemansia sp. S17]KAJ2021432.1 hypothetical protein GGI14_000009 [Coemansia sp. S680]KAJ2047426.1 hypothetical protein H4S04_004453 [Coemansia sp. S16]KAJ2050567.1 hypothetical protein GGI08_005464 [Coemansia sp. S2]KAJ2073219.1 hypothetical protein GGH13_002148 [Coemansia sp. S155-1]KAJ2095582.1 hypothetical protein GGI16_005158 [Coemansia sp. S142-1]KAJ2101142.1 hypothetical protein GGI09_001913 [Coemansia sp. S100]KAJ2264253.1 hypothetical protein GGI
MDSAYTLLPVSVAHASTQTDESVYVDCSALDETTTNSGATKGFADASIQTDDYVLVDYPTREEMPTDATFARKVYAIAAMQFLTMLTVGASLYYFECTCHFIESHQYSLRTSLAAAVMSMLGLSLKSSNHTLNTSLLATLVVSLAYFVGVSFLTMPGSITLQTLAITAGMLSFITTSTYRPGFEIFRASHVAAFAVSSVGLISSVYVMLPFRSFTDLAASVAIALALTGHVVFRTREASLKSTANSEVISAMYYISMVFFNPLMIYSVLYV